MKILWLTWKDRTHPLAGGAEIVNEELGKRLASDGHEITFLVGGFPGALGEEMREGMKIIRVGGRWSVYWHAYRYYKKHLRAWPDLVIDEVNTVPFFAKFYVQQKNLLFIHQLCREIWFYQMFFPLNIIGYILEPLYLRLLRDRKVITVSESTKKELCALGFKEENISIISEGIEIDHVPDLTPIQKYDVPTILSIGSLRAMKRTDHIIQAFELLKKEVPNAELVVAGKADDAYGMKCIADMKESPYASSIKYLGPVSKEQKIELLQKAHILAVASVKEGWGLVVTEANSQGTPAVVYDVDGLRDAVQDNKTGLVSKENTPQGLAQSMALLLKDRILYDSLRGTAWESSKDINFERGYTQFLKLIKELA